MKKIENMINDKVREQTLDKIVELIRVGKIDIHNMPSKEYVLSLLSDDEKK